MPPSTSHTMNPPGACNTFSSDTIHAPTAAKVSWHSAIIPAEPVTMPSPRIAIEAVTALIARKTKYPGRVELRIAPTPMPARATANGHVTRNHERSASGIPHLLALRPQQEDDDEQEREEVAHQRHLVDLGDESAQHPRTSPPTTARSRRRKPPSSAAAAAGTMSIDRLVASLDCDGATMMIAIALITP